MWRGELFVILCIPLAFCFLLILKTIHFLARSYWLTISDLFKRPDGTWSRNYFCSSVKIWNTNFENFFLIRKSSVRIYRLVSDLNHWSKRINSLPMFLVSLHTTYTFLFVLLCFVKGEGLVSFIALVNVLNILHLWSLFTFTASSSLIIYTLLNLFFFLVAFKIVPNIFF